MAKLKPGDTFANVSATDYNRCLDASDIIFRNSETGQRRGASSSRNWDTNIVKVKNSSGTDLVAGQILEFNNLLFTDLAGDIPLLWYNGIEPVGNSGCGVLMQPIPNGEMGEAIIAGAWGARVNVTNTNHRWARVQAGEHDLQSAFSGPIFIDFKPSGTGLKLCGIRIGMVTSTEIHRGVADEILPKDDTGTVSRYNPGTLDDSGTNDEVYNEIAPIALGQVVYYFQQGSTFYLLQSEKVSITPLTNLRLDSDSLETKARTIYADSVDTNTTWTEKVEGEDC
jgi:hypothetical protein